MSDAPPRPGWLNNPNPTTFMTTGGMEQIRAYIEHLEAENNELKGHWKAALALNAELYESIAELEAELHRAKATVQIRDEQNEKLGVRIRVLNQRIANLEGP